MAFSSIVFLSIFMPIVIGAYFLLPKSSRNAFLLFASLFFYLWGESRFLFVIFTSIIINYFAGIAIDKNKDNAFYKKTCLIIGIACNLGLLFYFKYFNFFVNNLSYITFDFFKFTIPVTYIVLPLGISFFTFQGLSYIIDLYREKFEVQKNFLNLALYISLFPQLIAGPIVRYETLHDEIINRKEKFDDIIDGLKQFSFGLGKKVIIANSVGKVADEIFALSPNLVNSPLAW